MRPTPTYLTSAALSFDRDGGRLIAVEPDAVAIVDLARSATIRIEQHAARAAIGFADQIWVASHDDRLLRFAPDGSAFGDPLVLPFAAPAMFVAAPCGDAAALWGDVALHAEATHVVKTAIPEVDLALPLTHRRHVVAARGRLVMPSGVATPLASSVSGGAVLADGMSAALVIGTGATRQVGLLSLGTGRLSSTLAVPTDRLRLATRRGIVLALIDPTTLLAIDLRAGKRLGMVTLDRDVRDLAIDPDGKRVVLRSTHIEILELDELLSWSAQAVTVEAEGEATPTETIKPTIVAAPAAAPAVVEPAFEPIEELPTALALSPRVAPEAIAPRVVIEQLELELRRVALWALHAIAVGWDTRRIGYGNEGQHPYELEVAAILGLQAGHATEYVAAAAERCVEHDALLASNPAWRAPGTPIGQLVSELGLSARAIDILLVIAAGSLWGEIARLYGILANDLQRATVDELLVSQVLASRHDRHAIAAELDPRAPLVRLGLVSVSTRRARPFAELAVEPVLLDLLRGIAPELGEATIVRSTERRFDELDLAAGTLAAAATQLARASAAPRILIRGRSGSGRTTLLAAFAASAGRQLAVIDALALPRHADPFQRALRQALRRAHLSGYIPTLVHVDDVTFDERAGREVAADVMKAHPGVVAVIASHDAPTPFDAGHISIELPVLTETERRVVWERAAAEASLANIDLDLLAARYRVGPGVIRRAVASVSTRDPNPTAQLDAFIRQTRDARLSQFARRVDKLATWSSIVLPPDITDSLRELIGRVRHRKTVFDTWGMSKAIATSRGLTALFQGPPGTGKTLVAGVIARELGLDLYQIDISKVMSKWIGETERNLSQIFDAAEDGQVVLLFDEADSLFAKRTEVRSSNDRYANLEVNYLLQRLDAFEGIAILTTNLGTSIDQAFKRRMSFRLSFPFPDEETREQLWRAHLPPEMPIEGALALDVLARKYQLSGGYIRNACMRAAFLAAQSDSALHQHHLERAVALEFAELGKLSTNGTID
ncbi:MAG: ATP-binding protein [Kofleriaceae bacterium]